jgi:hypothetical protein
MSPTVAVTAPSRTRTLAALSVPAFLTAIFSAHVGLSDAYLKTHIFERNDGQPARGTFRVTGAVPGLFSHWADRRPHMTQGLTSSLSMQQAIRQGARPFSAAGRLCG